MSPTNNKLPEKIAKYTQLSLIGEGACARVFKAFDPELERDVALKLLSERFSADPAMREQFFKEIKIQAGLNIPGIVKVFDCGSAPEGLYYTMELVSGEPLDKYCWDRHLSLPEKLKLIAAVAAIVDKLHAKGMLHRDIKPRNVMVDEYGQVKLLDLGLAVVLEDEMEQIGDFKISGSPAYMPPEALQKRNIKVMTTAADVYSLSVMAYEIICVFLPYDVDFLSLDELSEVINNEKPQAMETPFRENIPARVKKLIMRGLSVNPGKRPKAQEIADILMRVADSGKHRGAKVAAIIAAVAIAVVIIYHLTVIDRHSEPENSVEAGLIQSVKMPKVAPVKTVTPVKIFYKNSSPARFRDEWKGLKKELAANPDFSEKGALYYHLPDKCLVKFKTDGADLRTIDSRFEQAGSLFYEAGSELTIELRKESWGKPEIFHWRPQVGSADVFCPGDEVFKKKSRMQRLRGPAAESAGRQSPIGEM